MKTTATTTDELNEIYNFVKETVVSDPFKGSLHNLLWQLIVNRVHEDKTQSFYNVYHNGDYVLARVIENEAGFINTNICFKDNITQEKAREICRYMNEKCFGQSVEQSDAIISSSFIAQKSRGIFRGLTGYESLHII